MRSWSVTPSGVSITLGTTTARIGLDQREMRLMARQLLQAAEERDAAEKANWATFIRELPFDLTSAASTTPPDGWKGDGA